jgi:hypothetical protein
VIGFHQVRRVDLFDGLPGVVAFGVSFPFDEVLEPPRSAMTSVAQYSLHLVLFFSADKVRWGTGEVRSEVYCFMIGR